MEYKSQIKSLLAELNHGVYEKEEVISLTLLAALSGESIFLLGAPGVAKSMIARRLKFAFSGGTSFEYLMNRFSTPDEIFGPVSISKLKNEDKYERIVTNYLPSATVVFLDEIWKAGPSIQNALLTVLNEKIYRNGDREILVPMKALISASNELPMKGEGLEALWDRFIVRCVVGSVDQEQNFNDMITKDLRNYEDNVTPQNKIDEEKYNRILSSINNIEVPEVIFSVIHAVRNKLQSYNQAQEKEGNENRIYVSDRRWKKIVQLMRTSALLNDRKAVDLMDCFLMIHCIWQETNERKAVSDMVKETVRTNGYTFAINVSDLREELAEFSEDVSRGCSFVKSIKYQEPQLFYDKYYQLEDSLDASFNGTFDLILQKEFTRLTSDPKLLNIYCNSGNSGDLEKPKKFILTKGQEENTVMRENQVIKLVLKNLKREKTFSMKAPTSAQKKFLERYNLFLSTTSEMKQQLREIRQRDMPHFKTNLFVHPDFAEIAEIGHNNALKEIEKLEVEADRIRHYWENAEDENDDSAAQPVVS